MVDLQLDMEEGILLQTTDAVRYVGEEEIELDELLLTNQNLICAYDKSMGLFSKAQPIVEKIPLSSIKVANGIVQVAQVDDTDYGDVLQVVYQSGKRDLFEFYHSPKKTYPRWRAAISDAVLRCLGSQAKEETTPHNKTTDKAASGTSATAFCSRCGARLDPGAKFCKSCGFAVLQDTVSPAPETELEKAPPQPKEEKAPVEPPKKETPLSAGEPAVVPPPIPQSEVKGETPQAQASAADFPKSQRKTVYEGELHKCPQCGEVLNSFTAKCPTCGFELRGTSAASSVQQFAQKLEQSQTSEQRCTVIRNFPIPNTREDILEFMILASTNIAGEAETSVFEAWVAKFEQSYQKAQIVIQNPSDMAQVQSIHDKAQKQISRVKSFHRAKAVGGTLSKSGKLLRRILLLIGKSAVIIAGVILFIVAIDIDQSGGNSSMHELIGVILLIASAATLTSRNASYTEILIGAGSGGLSFYFASQLDNGAMLQLGGAIVLVIVVISFFKKLAKKEDR